jgi:hypothetical protein
MVTRRLILEFMFVLGIAAISACCLAADTVDPNAGGACTRPAAEVQTSVVDVPSFDTSSSDDPAADADAQAAQKLWQAYQTSVFQALAASSDPHDWALATLVYSDALAGDSAEQRRALIERAVAGLPDDPMVLSIALEQARGQFSKSTGDDALQSLQILEADNAAVWDEVLVRAAKINDVGGVDTALARMAASTKFDTHWTDALKQLLVAYGRHPVPEEYIRLAYKDSPRMSGSNAARLAATNTWLAMALPALQYTLNACRVNQATGENASRAGDCATVGRLMATQGDILLVNRIGLAVLRVSLTFTQEDIRQARPDDWVYHQYSLVAGQDSADYPRNYQEDWFESGSEIGAMRRRLLRAGISVVPPDHWVDNNSVFSEERLHSDEEYLKTKAPPH